MRSVVAQYVPVSAVYCELVLVWQCLHIGFLSVCHFFWHLISWHSEKTKTLTRRSSRDFTNFITRFSLDTLLSLPLYLHLHMWAECWGRWAPLGKNVVPTFLCAVLLLRSSLFVFCHSSTMALRQFWVKALHYTVSLVSYCVYLLWMWKNLSRLYLTQRQ